jgi:hypothetical protein
MLAMKQVQIKTHKESMTLQVDWQSSRTQTTTNAGEDVVRKRNPHTLLVRM